MSTELETAREHWDRAVDLTEQAEAWMDVDHGWKGQLSQEDRLRYRIADLAQAQVHATLALAGAQLHTANRIEYLSDRLEGR